MSITSSSTFFLQLLLVLICMNSTSAGSIRGKNLTAGEKPLLNSSIIPSRTETILPNSNITKSVEPVSNFRNTDDTLKQNIKTKLGSSRLLGYPLVPRDITRDSIRERRIIKAFGKSKNDREDDFKEDWTFNAQNHGESSDDPKSFLFEGISDSPKAFLFANDNSKVNWEFNAQNRREDISDSPKAFLFATNDWKFNAQNLDPSKNLNLYSIATIEGRIYIK